jgi:biopolymer transport protein ExbB/TolQ
MFSIPTWALPLLLTLVVAVLGFAYRLAVRAERLTDKLEGVAERMAQFETRLATVAALETAVTQGRIELSHERDLRERLEARVNRLEERLTATPVPR